MLSRYLILSRLAMKLSEFRLELFSFSFRLGFRLYFLSFAFILIPWRDETECEEISLSSALGLSKKQRLSSFSVPAPRVQRHSRLFSCFLSRCLRNMKDYPTTADLLIDVISEIDLKCIRNIFNKNLEQSRLNVKRWRDVQVPVLQEVASPFYF
jgi:hypothetical protein